MRYIFTKKWHRKMQVAGFLTFHETKEDWDNDVAWYEAEGRNFEEECRRDLEHYKRDLLEFLPESFHPYIHDGTIRSQFPSPELRAMAEQWKKEYDEHNRSQYSEYRSHFLSIQGRLPKNVVQLYEKSLHDARVLSFEIPNKDTFSMVLDCSGAFHYYTDIRLTFKGVDIDSLNISEVFVGSSWIYDEVYLASTGFELHVLFESPLGELTITAQDVEIEILE